MCRLLIGSSVAVSVSYTPHSFSPGAAMAAESLASLPFFSSDELIVTHEDAETGVLTVLVEDDDYTIAGLAAGGALSTAATIAATAEWPAEDIFHVERRATLRQEAEWEAFEHPPALDLQRTLDRAVLGVQEARELAERGFVVPLNPASVAGMYPVVDADGLPAFASGTGADDGLRTDLAATGPTVGAALVKANAQRSVKAKGDEQWWIGDFPGADATTRLQYGVAEGLRTIHVPEGTTVLEDQIVPVAPLKLAGVHKLRSKIYAPTVDDILIKADPLLAGALRGISACDLSIEMSRANPNSQIFWLYDNGNHPLERLQLITASKQLISALYGVGNRFIDIRGADGGRGVTGSGTGVVGPAIEVTGDGSDVAVGPYLESVYISYGTFRLNRCTDWMMVRCTSEYGNGFGVVTESSNGTLLGFLNEGCLLGGGHFIDSDVTRIKCRSLASPVAWQTTWTDVAGDQRMHVVDDPIMISASRATEFTPAGTTMETVPLEATGDQFFATRSTNRLIAGRSAEVIAAGSASILNTDAATQYATVSLVRYPVGGGGPLEVPRTTRHLKLLAGQHTPVSIEEPVSLTEGDGLELWFGGSSTNVHLKAEAGGAPATIGGVAVAPLSASLSIRPTGLRK